MKILILIWLLILLPSTFGANVKGTVYDMELNKVENAVVTVNTIPEQKIVGGDYIFELESGDYIIKAYYFEKGVFSFNTEENITILKEGNYNLDLFLFLDLDEEGIVSELDEVSKDLEEQNNYLYYFIVFSVIILMIGLIRMFQKSDARDDDDLNRVIEIIKKEGGRIHQKELRKRLGLSEAKISLMVTELESKNKVERIKNGRGNVIVLKK